MPTYNVKIDAVDLFPGADRELRRMIAALAVVRSTDPAPVPFDPPASFHLSGTVDPADAYRYASAQLLVDVTVTDAAPVWPVGVTPPPPVATWWQRAAREHLTGDNAPDLRGCSFPELFDREPYASSYTARPRTGHGAPLLRSAVLANPPGRPPALADLGKWAHVAFRQARAANAAGELSDEDFGRYCYVYRDSAYRFTDTGKAEALAYAHTFLLRLPSSDDAELRAPA